MQPIMLAADGVLKFQMNALVNHLVNSYPGGADQLRLDCPEANGADWEQLNQLLGWSVQGYSDLPYISAETIKVVDAMAAAIIKERAKADFVTFDVVTTKLKPVLSLFTSAPNYTVSTAPRAIRASEVIAYESVASYEYPGKPHACLTLRSGELIYVKQHVNTVSERIGQRCTPQQHQREITPN